MLIRAENLTKIYTRGAERVYALKGVDFHVASGDFVVISGPSGSGKTTLLNLLGLLDRPTEGQIYWEDKPVSALPERERTRLRRERIGFIFQSFNLLPVLSAYENVEYPLLLLGIPRRERRRRVEAILDEVGLRAEAHRRPSELSEGQCQRVAIARALVIRPALVLADEPSANIDSETTERIMGLMQRLNREHGATFVVVTHDPLVTRYARKVLHMRDGRLLPAPSGEEEPAAAERRGEERICS